MRLYHAPWSSNSRRVLLTAEQLRLPLDVQPINLMDPADRARLAEINPNGKVPVLEDGDLVLWESGAIMQYLCDIAGNQTLYPAGPAARADCNRWMFWAGQHFAAAVSVLTWERVWKGMVGAGPADPKREAEGAAELAQFATVLEGHLAGREWLVGKGLTIADFAVATPLMYLDAARLPLQQYPNLMRWFRQIETLEAWKNTNVALPVAE